MEDQGIALGVAQVPADKAIQGTPPPPSTIKTFPMVEELTIRAIINSEAHGYELLKCIQALVNELGADTIITVVRKIEKNPKLLTKAKAYLPYIDMLT